MPIVDLSGKDGLKINSIESIENPTRKMKTQTTPTNQSTITGVIKEDWHIVKGKLKQQYGELTDNDLAYVKGKEEELLGRLQKRMRRTRQEIEDLIRDCSNSI